MLKEIHEQPDSVQHTLSHYLDLVTGKAKVQTLEAGAIDFAAVDRIQIVACGTAFYAGQIGKYAFEKYAGLPCDVEIASEFRYRQPALTPGTLAVAVSQSGETADTLAALKLLSERGQTTLSIVNVPESSMARLSHAALLTVAGPEIGVASTKAFTAQLMVLACLAIGMGRARGTLDDAAAAGLTAALLEVPEHAAGILERDDEIQALAHEVVRARDVLFLGRGSLYPIAMEGALKLKEISYIHAEGYASGEMKHGPIALIDENVPLIVIAPAGPLFEKTVSNMHEAMARGAKVVLISDRQGIIDAGDDAMATIEMPKVHPLIAPIVYAVPVQLLAYHVAVAKGTDVDQPRNLAKSVTVE